MAPRSVGFTELPGGLPRLTAARPGPDLAAVGFAEVEYRVEGTARRIEEPQQPARFATRALVRAPGPDVFSGTVVVEWLNVSSGSDVAPDYTYLGEEIVRRGHVWVGVSAQHLGVMGGRPSVGGEPSPGLRGTEPERYGDLDHPGDAYCYDIFTAVATGLTAAGGPLAEHRVTRRIAVGESQSAFALTTYLNRVAPDLDLFDAYLVHSRGRAELGLGEPGTAHDLDLLRSGPPAPIRTDLSVPVITVQTETDVLSPRFRFVEARQDDTPLFRLWEVAGTAHADLWQIGEFESLLGCPEPVNRGQQGFVLRAALRALETWADGAPPVADRLAVDPAGEQFEVDAAGNVLGGVRTPCVEAPTQRLSGLAADGASVLCSLFGTSRDLAPDLLRDRYASAEDYLGQYEAAVDAAIGAGFVLAEDRAELLAQARPDRVASALS